MFFKIALEGKTQPWRYLVLFLAAFLASNLIGAIPLLIVILIAMSKNPDAVATAGSNIADLSAYGIDPNLGLVLMIIPFIVGLATILLLVKPLNGRSYHTLFNGSGSIRWRRFFYSFILWAVIMAIYMIISLKMNPSNFKLNNTSISLLVLAVLSLLLLPFQTTFEEILFRGYLMQGIGTWTRSKIAALIVTSLLFGLMHSFNPEVKEFGFWLMMPQYIIFGFVFGLMTVLDDGLELAMGAHAANNIFLSVFLTQKASALQTVALYEQQEVYPVSDLISLTIIAIVFILILSYSFGWKWKESFSYKKVAVLQ